MSQKGKPHGPHKRGILPLGRPPGAENLVKREFKSIVQRILEEREEKFLVWLDLVAEGRNASYNADGFLIREGVAPDPGKALEIIIKLAEYAAPKESKTVIAGDPDNPLIQPVLQVMIGDRQLEFAKRTEVTDVESKE